MEGALRSFSEGGQSLNCLRLPTAKHRPWKLKLYVAFETLELARSFERYLKSGSGHAFAKRHFRG